MSITEAVRRVLKSRMALQKFDVQAYAEREGILPQTAHDRFRNVATVGSLFRACEVLGVDPAEVLRDAAELLITAPVKGES